MLLHRPRKIARRIGRSKASSKYPRPALVFVDVDGTLILSNGEPNYSLISKLRAKKDAGFSLVLWSFQGEEHAREAARKSSCEDIFSHVLGKPGYIVDDKGWTWTRYVGRITEK